MAKCTSMYTVNELPYVCQSRYELDNIKCTVMYRYMAANFLLLVS